MRSVWSCSRGWGKVFYRCPLGGDCEFGLVYHTSASTRDQGRAWCKICHTCQGAKNFVKMHALTKGHETAARVADAAKHADGLVVADVETSGGVDRLAGLYDFVCGGDTAS